MVLSTEHGFEYMVLSAQNSFIQRFPLDFCGRIHNLGRIQNVGDMELFEEKIWCFIGERFLISTSRYFFAGLPFIS